MEVLLEIILSILFDGPTETAKSIPKVLRIAFVLFVFCLFLFIIQFVGLLAINMWSKIPLFSVVLLSILFLIIFLYLKSIIKAIKKLSKQS